MIDKLQTNTTCHSTGECEEQTCKQGRLGQSEGSMAHLESQIAELRGLFIAFVQAQQQGSTTSNLTPQMQQGILSAPPHPSTCLVGSTSLQCGSIEGEVSSTQVSVCGCTDDARKSDVVPASRYNSAQFRKLDNIDNENASRDASYLLIGNKKVFSATKVTDSICENVGILGDRLVPIAEADEYLSASSGSDDVLDDALARVQAGRRQSQDDAAQGFGSTAAFLGSTSTETSVAANPIAADLSQPLNDAERVEFERLRELFNQLTIGDVDTLSGSGQSPSMAAFLSNQEAASVPAPHVTGWTRLYDDDGNLCSYSTMSDGTVRYIGIVETAQQVAARRAEEQQRMQQNVQRSIQSIQQFISTDNPTLSVSGSTNPVQPILGHPVGEASTGTPSLIPKEIKVEKPSTFTGRHADLSNFLFEMKQYIDTVGLGNDGKACRFFVSYLKGDALTWWRSFSAHRPDVFSQLTLDVLIDALEEQFQDIDRDLKLRDKLLKLHQTGTVQQFVTQFKQLQLELGKEAFGNELALHCFTQGLKPLTRQAVMMHRPKRFDEAVVLAERADQTLLWNRSAVRPNVRPQHVSQAPQGGRGVSQYSNSRFKGPAPMVLGQINHTQKMRSDIICHHCGKKGHTKRTCFQLHPELKTRGPSTSNSGKQTQSKN